MTKQKSSTTPLEFLRGFTIFVGFIVVISALVLMVGDERNWPLAAAVIISYLWVAGFLYVVADIAESLRNLTSRP